jgi:hypothetical protein
LKQIPQIHDGKRFSDRFPGERLREERQRLSPLPEAQLDVPFHEFFRIPFHTDMK